MGEVHRLFPVGLGDLRTAVHDALGEVAYQQLDRDRLADILSEALVGKQVVGDDAAFAAGTRNAVEAIDTIRIPWLAHVLRPKWFQDVTAVRELLADTVGFVKRGDIRGIRKTNGDLALRKILARVRDEREGKTSKAVTG